MDTLNNGLVYYWPINVDTNDIIANANIYDGVKVSYVNDRLNKPNSTLYLTVIHCSVPSNAYFYGDFTFSIWFYFEQFSHDARIFDFGDPAHRENVVLYLNSNNILSFFIDNYGTSLETVNSLNSISLKVWYHVALTLKNTTGKMYINGAYSNSASCYIPRNIIRTKNY